MRLRRTGARPSAGTFQFRLPWTLIGGRIGWSRGVATGIACALTGVWKRLQLGRFSSDNLRSRAAGRDRLTACVGYRSRMTRTVPIPCILAGNYEPALHGSVGNQTAVELRPKLLCTGGLPSQAHTSSRVAKSCSVSLKGAGLLVLGRSSSSSAVQVVLVLRWPALTTLPITWPFRRRS